MTEIIKRRLDVPIFCILLMLYCILVRLPDQWFLWAFIAIVLDCIINPIYSEVELIE